MAMQFRTPAEVMRYAIDLARRGEGLVEPNPMVGAVLVDDELRLIAASFHERFGGPHAEVRALEAAGLGAAGSTLYVTLEPCCHFGKTPPCSTAVIRSGVRRVVIGLQDPFPKVAGGGIAELRRAGIDVEVGLLEPEVRALNAPFLCLVEQGRPYVLAKWAMTLDGKIAARTRVSRWISNDRSRGVVHRLRGRMDAIVVGIGTALADDPLLTARPSGVRRASRVVLDTEVRLPESSQLVQTARQVPVLLLVGPAAMASASAAVDRLLQAGVDVVPVPVDDRGRVSARGALEELGRRKFTNVLVEGGEALLGSLLDERLIDEAHVFIAPRLLGGGGAGGAVGPIAGLGYESPGEGPRLHAAIVEQLDGDVYIRGTLAWSRASEQRG